MEKISVMIIDDHLLVREAWSLLLNLEGRYNVVDSSGDGEQAVERARQVKPELILLDINMAPLNGFEILKLIRKYLPATKVIAVSMHTQSAFERKMFRWGARGYVTKNSSSEELLKAIDHVLKGKIYICNEIKNLFVEQTMDNTSKATSISNLSERELEIIRYIRDGLSSKEIGKKIFIAPKTVEVHRHNILKKLDVRNFASLIELVNVYGL